jgi:hypothetical protein
VAALLRNLPTDLSRFWGVFWVDVSTTGTAERSFLDVAQKLSIPAQTWDDSRLGIANLKHPWLLILDKWCRLPTLSVVNNLGNLYSDQGKMAEAEEMYQRALVGYEKALGPDHTSTLSTVNNLVSRCVILPLRTTCLPH